MRPECYFTQVGQGVLAAVSTRTFQVGASALRFCSGPAFKASGSSPFGGGGGAHLIGVLQAVEGKGLDQLGFPGVAAIHGIHVGQVPRAAERQDDPIRAATKPGQKSWRSTSRNAGFTGG